MDGRKSLEMMNNYTPFTRSIKHQANAFKIHVDDVCSNCLMFAWCLLHRVNGLLTIAAVLCIIKT